MDRGSEFCNQVMRKLFSSYGVEIRVISGGRPQANGIAEAQVKNFKSKMKSFILERSNVLCLRIILHA